MVIPRQPSDLSDIARHAADFSLPKKESWTISPEEWQSVPGTVDFCMGETVGDFFMGHL